MDLIYSNWNWTFYTDYKYVNQQKYFQYEVKQDYFIYQLLEFGTTEKRKDKVSFIYTYQHLTKDYTYSYFRWYIIYTY